MSHMSVQEMIDATPLGPILDIPVGEVLVSVGLPPLPVLPPLPPLPGLPPMPTINLDHLVKPITDLLGGFGTGKLPGGGFDPSVIFQSLSKVLETSMSMGQGALGLADKLWTGQASTSAAAKTAAAAIDSGALATQGTGMSFDINGAAAIVAQGLATVQGILATTVASIGGCVPIILSPGFGVGIGMAVAAANLGLAQATVAVAATRAALLGPTGQMTVNGTKVPVTNAPNAAKGADAQSPFAIASSVLGVIQPGMSMATELPSTLLKPVNTNVNLNKPTRTTTDTLDAARRELNSHNANRANLTTKNGNKGGGSPGGGALGVPGVAATLSSARATVPTSATAVENTAMTTQAQNVRGQVAAQPMPMGGGGAPMGAAGAGRAGANEQHSTPDYLVTEINGQQVVGEAPEVVPAVLGFDGDIGPDPSPDIELRLGTPGTPT